MPLIDITGQRYERLTVIALKETKNKKSYWECKCDCGNTTIVRKDQLKSGKSKSCGCLNIEKIKQGRNHSHGHSKTRLYRTFHSMKARCCNPNNNDFKDYGGRGIKICEQWLNDFLEFRKWALKTGYNDNLTIERINVNGNYEPSNCKWVTRKIQSRNTRQNNLITISGITKCFSEWCEIYSISKSTVKDRMNNGWETKQAITTPVKRKTS